MAKEFITYRRQCFTAIRELLVCEPKEVVDDFITKAKATKNERQLSQIMTEVRQYI